MSEYLFSYGTLQKEKVINIPDDILLQYLSSDQLKTYRESGTGIISITLYAEKPLEKQPCCGPSCCN